MKKQTITLITGGFDPLHSGHIAYIQAARKLGDLLIVGVNSDSWLVKKKGKAFLPWEERAIIVESIKGVHFVLAFDDSDGSAKDAILEVRKQNPESHIIFANGGDRTSENIPEMSIRDECLSFVFGIGGEDKKNSSSWILRNLNK